eukprot:GHVN01096483.1.p1 GENE.GHVN01096483.1~~GHVN01096483.1.p1  ORF type:complete len:446 (+),score=92.76 GHVN01096483.1:74-1411(+)
MAGSGLDVVVQNAVEQIKAIKNIIGEMDKDMDGIIQQVQENTKTRTSLHWHSAFTWLTATLKVTYTTAVKNKDFILNSASALAKAQQSTQSFENSSRDLERSNQEIIDNIERMKLMRKANQVGDDIARGFFSAIEQTATEFTQAVTRIHRDSQQAALRAAQHRERVTAATVDATRHAVDECTSHIKSFYESSSQFFTDLEKVCGDTKTHAKARLDKAQKEIETHEIKLKKLQKKIEDQNEKATRERSEMGNAQEGVRIASTVQGRVTEMRNSGGEAINRETVMGSQIFFERWSQQQESQNSMANRIVNNRIESPRCLRDQMNANNNLLREFDSFTNACSDFEYLKEKIEGTEVECFKQQLQYDEAEVKEACFGQSRDLLKQQRDELIKSVESLNGSVDRRGDELKSVESKELISSSVDRMESDLLIRFRKMRTNAEGVMMGAEVV